MRLILAILIIPVITGCANTEWLTKTSRYGYKDYDPCIRCGEKWDQIPNEQFEAQKKAARGMVW